AGLAALALFVPQLVAWRCVFGHWLVRTEQVNHNWLHPALWQVLLSQDRSLLYWTPLTFLGCAGYAVYFLGGLRRPREAASEAPTRAVEAALLLALAFALQVYVVASLWGGEVMLGASFGFRQL